MLEALGAALAGGVGGLGLTRLVPSERHQRRLVVLAAAAFAVAGALAPPAATGLSALDAVLRGGLVALTVLLAAWAGPWAVLAAAALALPGAGTLVWPAAAGLGVAAAAVALGGGVRATLLPKVVAAGAAGALGRRERATLLPRAVAAGAPVAPGGRERATLLPRAVAAGAASLVSLRLTWPRPSLATAVLAAVVFGTLGVAGVGGLPTRPRRTVVRAGLALLGVAGLAGASGAVAAALARPAVEDGMAAATAGLEAAGKGDDAGAATRLAAAARDFATARSRLDAWWARPALGVPVVARNSRALSAIAAAGSDVAAAAARTLAAVEEAGIHLQDGAVPVARFSTLRAPVAAARAVLARARSHADAVRSPWLVPPVSSRLDRLAERATDTRAGLADALVAFDLVPRLLGGDGPRRWFLAVQTPSEARASGGFIGNFGEISADGGRLRLDRVGRTAELNTGGRPGARTVVAPPDYVARYGRFEVDRLWQNVTMSPDFPTVAEAITGLYPQSGGRAVDGVVAIDPIGLAGLLDVLGPVTVPGWPVPLTGANADRILLFEQYTRLDQEARVDFLGRVVEAVWQRLTTTDAGALALARALGPMVAQKHLLVASTHDEGEKAALTRLGVSGGMAPVRGDFLGVVTQNAGGNKIDWFLRRSVDYRARLDPATGHVRSTVRITLRNRAPAGGLPPVVIESLATPPTRPGANKLYLSVYTPLSLSGARVDGADRPLESEEERGRNVFSTYVTVPPGGSTTVELDLAGPVVGGRRYRLDLHRQPFLAPDAVTATVGVPDGWRVGESKRRVSLVSDARVETAIRRD